MCVENGWSGFALGLEGTDAEGGCWFKKVGYKLTPSRLRVNMFVDKFHIYSKYLPFRSNNKFVYQTCFLILTVFRQAKALKIKIHSHLTYLQHLHEKLTQF